MLPHIYAKGLQGDATEYVSTHVQKLMSVLHGFTSIIICDFLQDPGSSMKSCWHTQEHRQEVLVFLFALPEPAELLRTEISLLESKPAFM